MIGHVACAGGKAPPTAFTWLGNTDRSLTMSCWLRRWKSSCHGFHMVWGTRTSEWQVVLLAQAESSCHCVRMVGENKPTNDRSCCSRRWGSSYRGFHMGDRASWLLSVANIQSTSNQWVALTNRLLSIANIQPTTNQWPTHTNCLLSIANIEPTTHQWLTPSNWLLSSRQVMLLAQVERLPPQRSHGWGIRTGH